MPRSQKWSGRLFRKSWLLRFNQTPVYISILMWDLELWKKKNYPMTPNPYSTWRVCYWKLRISFQKRILHMLPILTPAHGYLGTLCLLLYKIIYCASMLSGMTYCTRQETCWCLLAEHKDITYYEYIRQLQVATRNYFSIKL